MRSPSTLHGVQEKSAESSADAEAVEDEIKALLARLPMAERAALVRRISKTLPASSTPRAGPVLEAVVTAIPDRAEWTVSQIKDAVQAQGLSAKSKEIYNAITYLARRGQIKQVGYSRYLVVESGAGLTTADDLGLEPKEDGE